MRRRARDGFCKGADKRQVELRLLDLRKELLEEARVAGIVFEDEDPDRSHALSVGSRTTVNQKSSIDLTTATNWSRSTGFMM